MIATTAILENYVLISADAIFPEILQFNNRFKLEDWTLN
jgi:hypothetical protein